MIRVLSSACVVVLLLAVGGSAWAGPKPTIAVLGLEVSDSGTGIDPETTRVAKELTAALRARAVAGSGPYALAPNGEKELIDEKLLNNCDTEAAVCMSAIGVELNADLVMFGKIEKKAATYQVSLKLLYVSHKQVTSTSEPLPVTDATGVRLSTYAKTWYAKLVGGTSGGIVLIKSNADRGTVLIDDENKGSLTSGMLSLEGVPEGRHTLAIEAKDYQRYETQITVRNGETLSHTATLAEMSKRPVTASQPTTVEGTVSARSKSNIWKPVFYSAAAVDAALIGYTLYQYSLSQDNADKVHVDVSNSDCGDSKEKKDSYGPVFAKACSHYHNYTVGWIVSSVVGAAVLGSFYMAFIRDRDHAETQTATGGHKKRREFAVTPIISPNGGGATLQIDW